MQTKQGLIGMLSGIKTIILVLRDDQEVVPCNDKDDICNYFDQIADRIDDTIDKIRGIRT